MKTRVCLISVLLLAWITACSGFAGKATSQVWLDEPLDGAVYRTGETIKLIAHARGANGPGITNVSFSVGNRQLGSAGTDATASIVMASANWEILEAPGIYTVTATALDTAGNVVTIDVNVEVIGTRTVGGSLPDKCEQLAQREINLVDLGWLDDGGYLVYFKIGGGVPGLKVNLPGLDGPWNYQASAGEGSSGICHVENFSDRLFCSFDNMVGGQGQKVGFHLAVDGCDLFSGFIDIPMFIVAATEPPESDIGSPPVDCGAEPDHQNPAFETWCLCEGGSWEDWTWPYPEPPESDHPFGYCTFP